MGGVYSGFRINYTPIDVVNYTHIPVGGSKDIPVVEITLDGLLPGTSYELQVMTVSEDTISTPAYGNTITCMNNIVGY